MTKIKKENDQRKTTGLPRKKDIFTSIILRPRSSPPPPAFGLICEGAIGQPVAEFIDP